MFPGVRIKPPLLADYVALTDLDVHGAGKSSRPAIGLILTVEGRKTNDDDRQYLHRGIAARAFTRRFNLKDHVEVEQANYENGLLQIDLVRKIPEAMKPRKIAIGTGNPSSKPMKSLNAA